MIRGLPQIIRDYQGTVALSDQFNYGVNLSYQHQGNETTASEFDLERAAATVNGGYSQSSTYRQAGASALGALSPGRVALIWRTVFPKRLL